MPPEISVGNPLALMAESTELHLTTVTLATCSANRRSHNYSNLQKRALRGLLFSTLWSGWIGGHHTAFKPRTVTDPPLPAAARAGAAWVRQLSTGAPALIRLDQLQQDPVDITLRPWGTTTRGWERFWRQNGSFQVMPQKPPFQCIEKQGIQF